MKFEIKNPGQHGIIRDLPDYELPENAWSDGRNISFGDGYITRVDGEELFFYPTLSSTSAEKVRYLDPIRGENDYYWVYCTDTSIWYIDSGGTKTNIKQAAASASQWTSGFLEGMLLISNEDYSTPFHPVAWVPGGALSTLTWDTSASTTWADVNYSARTMRTYRQYAVALDVVENTVRRPRRVRWSHPADPGAMPITWDETKPQYDAGYVDLDSDPEPVVDCIRLRGDNIIYKYNSVHRMTPIGAPYIFGFSEIFNNIGARSRNCVKEFYGKHAVFGFEDIVVHDGQEIVSILDHRMRKHIIGNVDSNNSDMCTVAIDHANNDIYFCYPEIGTEALTQAVIWNWSDNTTTIRDLDNHTYVASGLVSPTGGSVSFDNDVIAYDAMNGPFDTQLYSEAQRALVFSFDDAFRSVSVKGVNSSAFLNGTIVSFVERVGLPLPGSEGNVDTKDLKYINRIYIRGEGDADLSVKIGEQYIIGGEVKLHSFTFNPSTDYKIDCRVTTRIPSIRIGYSLFEKWKIYGITIEYQLAGMR